MQEIALILSSLAGIAVAAAVRRAPGGRRRLLSLGASSHIRSQIDSLGIEREILTKTISRLYESDLPKVQKDRLLLRYQHQLGAVLARLEKLEQASRHPDLGPVGDGLMTLMDQKLSRLDERLYEISSRIASSSRVAAEPGGPAVAAHVEAEPAAVPKPAAEEPAVAKPAAAAEQTPEPEPVVRPATPRPRPGPLIPVPVAAVAGQSVEITTLTSHPGPARQGGAEIPAPVPQAVAPDIPAPVPQSHTPEVPAQVPPPAAAPKPEVPKEAAAPSAGTVNVPDMQIPDKGTGTAGNAGEGQVPPAGPRIDEDDDDDEDDIGSIKQEILSTLSRLEQAEVE